MEAENKRRQVSYDQLTALLEFLKENDDLAKGLTRGRHRRGKFHTVKLWNLCAKKLNVIKGGALKDGKGWAKYWCDWKYRVRRRALEVKAAQDSDRPPAEGILPLSPMEENIMSIIGESAVEGVVIMGSDPLSEGGLDEAIQNYDDPNDDSPINQYFESETTETSSRSRKRRHLSNEMAGPSSPIERKPVVAVSAGTGTRSSKRRKKQPSINSDMDGGPSSPESKPEVTLSKNEGLESDGEDRAAAFLSIEREKLFGTTKIVQTLESIHSEISRLTTVMADIKDCISRHYRQIGVP